MVGCTTVPGVKSEETNNAPQAYEINRDGDLVVFRKHSLASYNRDTFKFNDSLDANIYRPVASAYRDYVPSFIRTGVRNFFSNLGDISVILNDLLQLKLVQAGSDVLRFTLNSTLGIFGLFDVATPMGLEKHNEDFGQTLGYWGVGEGPYLILPFIPLGMTIRDWTGFVVDNTYFDFGLSSDLLGEYNGSANVLKFVDLRANLLDRESSIIGDRYSFIRDAYLQNRRFLVTDGEVSAEDDFISDDYDDFDF